METSRKAIFDFIQRKSIDIQIVADIFEKSFSKIIYITSSDEEINDDKIKNIKRKRRFKFFYYILRCISKNGNKKTRFTNPFVNKNPYSEYKVN
jgi:hypothetical protein